jgi:CheY-like chemotaxis protein
VFFTAPLDARRVGFGGRTIPYELVTVDANLDAGQGISKKHVGSFSPAGDPSDMDAQGTSGTVILCIDDHVVGIELRKRVLEKAGFRVLVATSVQQALEIFGANHIDLVLTEQLGPTVASAPSLTATLKLLKPEVPVAILSADATASPEEMASADIFITKLSSPDELLSIVERLIRDRAKGASS